MYGIARVHAYHLIYGVCIQQNHLSLWPREIVHTYFTYRTAIHSAEYLYNRVCAVLLCVSIVTLSISRSSSSSSFLFLLSFVVSLFCSRSLSLSLRCRSALHSLNLRYKRVDGGRSVVLQRLLCANDYEHRAQHATMFLSYSHFCVCTFVCTTLDSS